MYETCIPAKSTSQHLFSVGGMLSVNGTLDSWIDTVKQQPFIIGGNLQPLTYLFDKHPETSGIAVAFNEAIAAESFHQDYKKILHVFKYASVTDLFMQQVIGVVEEQMDLVNPSKQLYHVLNAEIMGSCTFCNYNVTFQHSPNWMSCKLIIGTISKYGGLQFASN